MNDSVSPICRYRAARADKNMCVWLKVDPQINCVPEVHLLMKLLFGDFSGKKVSLVHHSYFSLKDRGSLEANDIIFQSIFNNVSEEKKSNSFVAGNPLGYHRAQKLI